MSSFDTEFQKCMKMYLVFLIKMIISGYVMARNISDNGYKKAKSCKLQSLEMIVYLDEHGGQN